MPARRPLIGRENELDALSQSLSDLRHGLSSAAVIVGEPGIGKSRLLDYAADAADGIRTIRIAGMESELRLGFAAVHRLLVPFLDRVDRLPTPQHDALLTTFGVVSGRSPARLLIGLATLSLLADAATEGPLICIVDDTQWLDQESLAVLGFVARRVHADGIGLLFAARKDAPGLAALEGLTTYDLGGLDRAESHALLESAHSGSVSTLVAARLVAESDGNPLALLELVRQLTSDQLAGRLPLPQLLPVGRGMQAHFLRQIEALPTETRSLLMLASAMSTDEPAVLWRAAELLGLAPDAAEPAAALDILSVGESAVFRHPLIRSAAYSGAEPVDRRRAHAALATVAEMDGDPDQAAWHRAAATTAPDEAVAAELDRCAERAELRGGQVAQALFLNRAAELSPRPEDRSVRLLRAARAYLSAGDAILAEALLDRAAPWLDAANLHVEVQRMRASIAVFFHRHKDAPAILMSAVREVDAEDTSLTRQMLFDALQAALVAREYTADVTPIDVARSALEVPRKPTGPASASDLLLDGFATRIAIGYERAVPLLREAVASLFTETPIGTAALPTTILGWFAADDLWDERGGREMFERAVTIERQHGALGALRITLAGLCTSQARSGEMDKAEQRYFEAAEVSALIGVPPPATTGVLLEVRAWQGREQESRDVAATTATWGHERGAAILETFSRFGLTILEMGLGNYDDALRSALPIYRDDPPGFGNRILPEVVEAGARSGDRATAEAALDRLSGRAMASGTPWALGMLSRSRALMGVDSEVENHFRDAITQLRATSLRTESARTHLLYGEWLRRRRRRNDARMQLQIAYDMFHSMGAAAFAARARREQLAAGYAPSDSPERANFGLTAQEVQVTRLAAAGATNAEIATHMFLTTSTVEYHLSKAFRKLGVSSRRQLPAASIGVSEPSTQEAGSAGR